MNTLKGNVYKKETFLAVLKQWKVFELKLHII